MPCLPVIKDPGVAAVSVLAQNQALQPKLHLVCIPDPYSVLANLRRTHFVFNRASLEPVEQVFGIGHSFHQIHLASDAVSDGTEHDRAGMNDFITLLRRSFVGTRG